MKLIPPENVPGPGRGTGHTRAYGKPQGIGWLKEWIADQPRRVILSCGHTEDLHDRTLLIIKSFDGTTILCEACNRFVTVVRGVKPAVQLTPDEPLF